MLGKGFEDPDRIDSPAKPADPLGPVAPVTPVAPFIFTTKDQPAAVLGPNSCKVLVFIKKSPISPVASVGLKLPFNIDLPFKPAAPVIPVSPPGFPFLPGSPLGPLGPV